MSSLIADGVMAATHKLVQQAMAGQWQEAPRTVEERRALLDRLSAAAAPQDQPWLSALQQAMAESDTAVAKMLEERAAGGAGPAPESNHPITAHSADGIRLARRDPSVPESNHLITAHSADSPTRDVDRIMDMIRYGR